jgi:hypothetical protein
LSNFNPHLFTKTQWEKAVVAAGFSLDHRNASISRNGIGLTVDNHWLQLKSDPAPNIADPLNAVNGEPGIWKLIADKDRQIRKVFEFPLFIITETNTDFGATSKEMPRPLSEALKWARVTLSDTRRIGWDGPSEQDIVNLLPRTGLTAQCGPYVRQGNLICKPDRLLLCFPLILNLSNDLPESHYFWLRKVLIDAQNRWKMVRVVFRHNTSATSVQAEVDLSGAPRSVLAGLVTVAISALHAVAAWVVPSAEFLIGNKADIWALSESMAMTADKN